MASSKKQITIVREHPLRVPVSEKNPSGLTLRDRHLRRLPGTFLDANEIQKIAKGYDFSNVKFPAKNKLKDFKDADKYDSLIAIWTDYFNRKFKTDPPMDPDMVKALLASESGFKIDPKVKGSAIGIAQITKKTLAISQDSNGEAKEFVFKNIKQKDLKNPKIAIPIAIRWLSQKSKLASAKLRRKPNHEEIILEYKGQLKSNSHFKDNALKNYRLHFNCLKSK